MKLLLAALSLFVSVAANATITNITYRVSSTAIYASWRSDVPENKASIRYAGSSSCANLSSTVATISTCSQSVSVTITGLTPGYTYCLQPFAYICFGSTDQDNTAVPFQVTTNQTDTATPTFTISQTSTISPTYSVTKTITPTITKTNTRTNTPSITPSNTPSSTVTLTNTRTITPSVTATNTPSITPSISPTSSITRTITTTNTPSITPSITATRTNTSVFTFTTTPTVTPTPTTTPTKTVTPTVTRTPNAIPATYAAFDGRNVHIDLNNGTYVNGYADVNVDYIRISGKVIPYTAVCVIYTQ